MNSTANTSDLRYFCAQCGEWVSPPDRDERHLWTAKLNTNAHAQAGMWTADSTMREVVLHKGECADAFDVIQHAKNPGAGDMQSAISAVQRMMNESTFRPNTILVPLQSLEAIEKLFDVDQPSFKLKAK